MQDTKFGNAIWIQHALAFQLCTTMNYVQLWIFHLPPAIQLTPCAVKYVMMPMNCDYIAWRSCYVSCKYVRQQRCPAPEGEYGTASLEASGSRRQKRHKRRHEGLLRNNSVEKMRVHGLPAHVFQLIKHFNHTLRHYNSTWTVHITARKIIHNNYYYALVSHQKCWSCRVNVTAKKLEQL